MINSSDGGKLGIQLRNQRRVNKRKEAPDALNQSINTLNESDAKQLIETMKLMIVNNDNMENFKSMLAKTLQYRTELLKIIDINLREFFPYFFVSHDLVIYLYSK